MDAVEDVLVVQPFRLIVDVEVVRRDRPFDHRRQVQRMQPPGRRAAGTALEHQPLLVGRERGTLNVRANDSQTPARDIALDEEPAAAVPNVAKNRLLSSKNVTPQKLKSTSRKTTPSRSVTNSSRSAIILPATISIRVVRVVKSLT